MMLFGQLYEFKSGVESASLLSEVEYVGLFNLQLSIVVTKKYFVSRVGSTKHSCGSPH